VKGAIKIWVICFSAAVFLGGSVNLYPCAAGAVVRGYSLSDADAVKSCHSDSGQKKHQGKEQKKSEKPCCVLHCYNPAHVEPLVKMTPPAIMTITIANEEVPYISLTITPPLPPPRIS
jgi:hypothetical protein